MQNRRPLVVESTATSPVARALAAARAEENARKKRIRQARRRTPADWQEAHSPTEAVRLEGPDGRKQTCRRRKQDSRLWEALDAEQTRAAQILAQTVEQLAAPVRPAVSRMDGLPPGTGHPEAESEPELMRRLRDMYVAWAERCKGHGVDHTVVVDVLVLGRPLSGVDRDRRRRKGWTRQELGLALDHYCLLRGWKRRVG